MAGSVAASLLPRGLAICTCLFIDYLLVHCLLVPIQSNPYLYESSGFPTASTSRTPKCCDDTSNKQALTNPRWPSRTSVMLPARQQVASRGFCSSGRALSTSSSTGSCCFSYHHTFCYHLFIDSCSQRTRKSKFESCVAACSVLLTWNLLTKRIHQSITIRRTSSQRLQMYIRTECCLSVCPPRRVTWEWLHNTSKIPEQCYACVLLTY